MERTTTQFSRLLELDRRIRTRRYPNAITFAGEYEVAQKTVQRDIDYLRNQGAPIEYDRIHKGYYYSDPTWFLPAVFLSEGDYLGLLVASQAAEAYRGTPIAQKLQGIFSKLAGLLPDKLSITPDLVAACFSFTGPPAKPIDPEIWTTLVQGTLRQQAVKIVYQTLTADHPHTRNIDPYHIANLDGEWYIFAHCREKDDVRQFSIARIRKAVALDWPFEVPKDFDPRKLLANTFHRYTMSEHPHTIRLLFARDVAPWVLERQWRPNQTVKKRKNGDIELQFDASGIEEVFRWVLAWGHNVQILGPEELKKMWVEEVRLMADSARLPQG